MEREERLSTQERERDRRDHQGKREREDRTSTHVRERD